MLLRIISVLLLLGSTGCSLGSQSPKNSEPAEPIFIPAGKELCGQLKKKECTDADQAEIVELLGRMKVEGQA